VKFGPLIKKNSCPDIDKNFEEEIDARKDMKESKRLKKKKKSVKTLLWHFKLESCRTYDLIKDGLTIKESKIKN
jgi:hypothetical protein